ERDDEAKPVDDGDILEESPLSVSTGRSLEEIAADRDWVLGKKKTAASESKAAATRPKKTPRRGQHTKFSVEKIPGAKAGKMPSQVDVELATLAKDAPEGEDWLHEIKFDGYRIICRID